MITKSSQHLWTYRALFLGLCLLIITAKILPITLDQGRLPSPDILLAVTLAWLLRQPSAVPVLSIVIVFLLADFLLQRPPGLWTLLVLLVSELVEMFKFQQSMLILMELILQLIIKTTECILLIM